MKYFLAIFFALQICFANGQVEVNQNCYRNGPENIMYMDMFPWGQTEAEMSSNFDKIYDSRKRMDNRVFFDGEKFLMPFVGFRGKVTYAEVPENFIKSIVSHINNALENEYVSHINFSDMGHNHLFIPREFYKNEISDLSMSTEKHIIYQKIMENKDIMMLYHTAEQLKFFDEDNVMLVDRSVQKRFYTRNLLGKNESSSHLQILFNINSSGNAAHDYKEGQYKYWGAGFSFSSTANGCFSYTKNGKIMYFDISADDIGYQQNNEY